MADEQEPLDPPPPVPADIGNAVSSLQKDVKLILDTLRTNQLQISEFQKLQQEILKSLNFNMERVEDLEKQVKKQSVELRQAETERSELTAAIQDMRQRLDAVEQDALANRLELRGVPADVPPAAKLHKLCLWAGIELAPAELLACRRLPARAPRASSAGTAADAATPPPPAVLVTLADEAVKEKVLLACRAKRPLRTNIVDSSLTAAEATPLYINESLTKSKKILLNETKKFASLNNYKFVWVKKGQIMIREKEGCKILYIKSKEDFLKLKTITAPTK